MINCPACGSNFEGELCLGCPSCGARSVGPPLARAEHELRSYGRAVSVLAGGVAMSGVFLASLVAVLSEYGVFPTRLGPVVSAAEVAAWRLKWVMLPIAIIVLWGGSRIIRSIKASPSKFMGLRAARLGFTASALVTLMIATLIGITIPERLRQRQYSIDAAIYARGYTLHRALLEYRELHGSLPTADELVSALKSLPDPDGSIAEALRHINPAGYQAGTVVASASTKLRSLVLRGSALRNAATNSNVAPAGVSSFDSYELPLPGERKLFSTDDDFIMRDGVIMKASEISKPKSTSLPRPIAP